jgi:hypothetical protein
LADRMYASDMVSVDAASRRGDRCLEVRRSEQLEDRPVGGRAT